MTVAAVEPVVPPLSGEMAERVAVLHARCFSGVPGATWSAGALRTIVETPTARCWLARGTEGPCGLVLIRAAGDDCEILTLGVDPRSRRSGWGGRLLRTVAKWAQMAGLERLLLEVAVTNSPALNLYDRFGFFESGCRPGYYRMEDGRVDALLLAASTGVVLNETRE